MACQFAFGRVSLQNREREISDTVNVHRLKITSLQMLERRYVILFLSKDRLSLKKIPIGK
jgi:hypothetical protein